MSTVTTVLINIPFGESREAHARLVGYFAERGTSIGRLDEAKHAWGGNKGPLVALYGGAYSHLDVEDLLRFLGGIEWKHPQGVQVFERPEDWAGFNVYTMKELRQWHRPPPVQSEHLP